MAPRPPVENPSPSPSAQAMVLLEAMAKVRPCILLLPSGMPTWIRLVLTPFLFLGKGLEGDDFSYEALVKEMGR